MMATEGPLVSGLLSSSSTVGQRIPHGGANFNSRMSMDSRMFSKPSDVCYGLLITLKKAVNGDSRVELSFTPDAQYPSIHPNAYAPAFLTKMRKLGGGGSGVAVFEGYHPTLGDIVMKHGGDKDLEELFALATIAEELKVRGKSSAKAAKHLQDRIPEFKMIYISPKHLGEKRRELWYKLSHLYKTSSRNLLVLAEDEDEADLPKMPKPAPFHRSQSVTVGAKNLDPLDRDTPLARRKLRHVPSRNGMKMTQSGTVSGHRDIAIYNSSDSPVECSVELLGDSLMVSIPVSCAGDGLIEPIPIPGDGYQVLKSIVDDLLILLKDHKWKLTMAQKRIGGRHPTTGNQWLYSGALEGKILDNLIDQKVQLIRELATLTTPKEKDPSILREVQYEVVRFEEEENMTPNDITKLTDSFVGNSIKKNFQHPHGRFNLLAQLGRQFREYSLSHPDVRRQFHRMSSSMSSSSSSQHNGTHLPALRLSQSVSDLYLEEEEIIPAHHLGDLTRQGALMGDTFENVPLEPSVLEMNPFYWRNLLRAAVQPRRKNATCKTSNMAMTRLWTCGLTDAGVHNLFLTEDSFWLFDLGRPALYSAPGFLTKFLFSFFHTLGMEEEKDDSATWVRRFEHSLETKKLRLTPRTKVLLNKAYDAFEKTLDRLIDELFDKDDALRWLLIQYVTLQLISDASFCLQRWTVKGGGRPRDQNHQKGIEKWLWRALWDIFMAFDINTSDTWTRLGVEHPSTRDSMFYNDMRDLINDDDFIAKLHEIDANAA